MRRLCFTYELTLDFSAPVSRHTFLFRFHPNSDRRQQLWGLETTCQPSAGLPLSVDAFGNLCACGHIEASHERLSLRVRGDALVQDAPVESVCPRIFAYPTMLTQADEALAALADGVDGSPVEAAMEIAGRLHERVRYQQGVTDDRTTAAEAFQRGEGVCQDMAHMLLAALRARRMPARYVAGLIPGEGETHAWVEVYDGGRFFGVDPTHVKRADDRYLCVSRGRDSRDCAINRGVFVGSAGQTMTVRARMMED